MKKNVVRVIAFVLIFITMFFSSEKILFDDTNICPTWSKLQDKQSEPFDILFMGNSHIYCSVNPIVLNQALEIKTGILGSSAQFMEMTLENLKILLKYQKPKTIILEMNAIIGKNEDRENLLTKKQGVIFDNLDGIQNYIDKFNYANKLFNTSESLSGTFQILRSTNRWSRWDNIFNKKSTNKYDGTYIEGYSLRNRITPEIFDINSVEKFYKNEYESDESIDLDENYEKSLIEFLNLTEKNNIDVWLIKSPITQQSADCSGKIRRISSIAKDYKNVKKVVDFNEQISDIGLEHDDFYDRGHLNRIGAEKFTEYLTNYIAEYMNISPNYNNVNFYKSENIEYVSNGLYRYSVDTYSVAKFSFRVKENNKVIRETEFSSNNFIDIPYVTDNQTIEVDIIPLSCPIDDKEQIQREKLTLQFIKNEPFKNNFNVTSEEKDSFKFENLTNYPFESEFAWYVLDDNGKTVHKTGYSAENSFIYKFDEGKSYKIKCFVKTNESSYTKSIICSDIIWSENNNRFYTNILK